MKFGWKSKAFLLFLVLGAIGHTMDTTPTPASDESRQSREAVLAAMPPAGPAAGSAEDLKQKKELDEQIARRKAEAAQLVMLDVRARLEALKAKPASSYQVSDFAPIVEGLKKITSVEGHDDLLASYRLLAKNTVESLKMETTDLLLETGAELWATRLDTTFLEQGSNIEVSARKVGTGYDGTVSYALMSRALAYKLANDAGLYESAKSVGINKIVFINKITDETWTYSPDGEAAMRSKLNQNMEQEWLFR